MLKFGHANTMVHHVLALSWSARNRKELNMLIPKDTSNTMNLWYGQLHWWTDARKADSEACIGPIGIPERDYPTQNYIKRTRATFLDHAQR